MVNFFAVNFDRHQIAVGPLCNPQPTLLPPPQPQEVFSAEKWSNLGAPPQIQAEVF